MALIKDFDFAGNISEAENGAELLKLLSEMQEIPDVILLDLKMPVMDGIEANQRIRLLYPDIKVIIITMEDNEQYILHLVNEGVHGYLLKNADPDEVEIALKSVMTRGFYFPSNISDVVMKNFTKREKTDIINPGFTERELEVLELICLEYSATEIADKMSISVRTAEGYRQKLLEKTGVKTSAGLVMKAIKYNWISLK